MKHVMDIANTFIRLEENRKAKQARQNTGSQAPKPEPTPQGRYGRQGERGQGQAPKESRYKSGGEGSSSTRGNTALPGPKSDLLLWIENNEKGLRYPPPLAQPGRDTTKWCKFHRDHGHLTDECRNLQKELELWHREGRLDKYTRREAGSKPTHAPTQQEAAKADKAEGKKPALATFESLSGMMNSIHGGYPEIAQGRKRKPGKPESLPDVVFGEEDRARIITPHRNALVISVVAENVLVRRVLVDGGSSVNMLPLKAFNDLGLSKNLLKPAAGNLVGLDSHKVTTIGWLELEIELGRGTPDNPGTLMQKWRTPFVVVDIKHPYNMLIGQPMLIDIDASTNLRSLQMKVPTTRGVITIQGTQDMAKECYIAAMKDAGENFQITCFHPNKDFQSARAKPMGEPQEVDSKRISTITSAME